MRRCCPSLERFGLVAALAFLVAAAPAAQSPKPGGGRPAVAPMWREPVPCSSSRLEAVTDCPAAWISPAELVGHYREHDVLIVDLRDRASYWRAHLPGAVSMNIDDLETLAVALCASDLQVVVYGDGASGDVPLEVVAALRRLGLASTQALEGGLDGWVADGRAVVTQPSAGLD